MSRLRLAEFELRNQIATALSDAGAFCGECGFEPGDRGKCTDCERCWSGYADALMPLFAVARGVTFREAAEVAVRAARGAGDDERGQYVASFLAGVAKDLRRLGAEGGAQ